MAGVKDNGTVKVLDTNKICLTPTTQWADSADDKLTIFFLLS